MPRTYGAAIDFLAKRFGGYLRPVESTSSIGITAVRLINFDAERIAVTFVNLSSNTVYIGPQNDVSATKGIVIPPGGGAVAINVEEDGILPTVEWYAVATAAASAVYVLSVKRDTALDEVAS